MDPRQFLMQEGEPQASVQALYMQAYSLKDMDPDAAIRKFQEVIRRDPDSPEAARAQGWIKALTGAQK